MEPGLAERRAVALECLQCLKRGNPTARAVGAKGDGLGNYLDNQFTEVVLTVACVAKDLESSQVADNSVLSACQSLGRRRLEPLSASIAPVAF